MKHSDVFEWLHTNKYSSTLSCLETEMDLNTLLMEQQSASEQRILIQIQILKEELSTLSSKQSVVKYLEKYNEMKKSLSPLICQSFESCLLEDSPMDHPLFVNWTREKGRREVLKQKENNAINTGPPNIGTTRNIGFSFKTLVDKVRPVKVNVAAPSLDPSVLGEYADPGKHPIRVASFSHNGNHVAIGTNSQSLVLCDSSNLSVLARNDLIHSGSVYTLAWSLDDAWIATGSNDQTIRLTNVSQLRGLGHVGAPTRLQLQAGTVRALAYFDSNHIVAGCSGDSNVRGVDVTTQKILWTHPMGSVVHSVAIDGKLVCCASALGTVALIDPRDAGNVVYTVSGQIGAVCDIHTNRIAVGTESGDVALYDIRKSVALWTREAAHSASCRSVALSANTLASVSFDKTGQLFELVAGKSVGALNKHSDRVVHVEWGSEDQLVTCGADAKAILWQIK